MSLTITPMASNLSAFHAVCLAATIMMAAVGLEAQSASADDLIVRYDQAQLLRMPRPVAEIIIGNPSIADVTIQGGNLLVVTGKTFGVTNIIALDGDRNVIQDQRVLVERDTQAGIVHLHRGSARQTYACVPTCGTTLTIGDDADYFSGVSKQNTTKIGQSEKGSEAERGSQ
jgi:Flp pilus assembly secretin CpaC